MGRKPAPLNFIPEDAPQRAMIGNRHDPQHIVRQDWAAKWKAERFTDSDIAAAMGVSRERVGQLLRKRKRRVERDAIKAGAAAEGRVTA